MARLARGRPTRAAAHAEEDEAALAHAALSIDETHAQPELRVASDIASIDWTGHPLAINGRRTQPKAFGGPGRGEWQ